MAKILSTIQSQAFEVIRDRVATILADEMENQFMMSGDYDLDLKGVHIERFVAFDHTELPAINVLFNRGEYPLKSSDSRVNANYFFNIDCYTRAASTDDEDGDTLATIKLQSIMGKCRAILENPVYKTLGFVPGIIMGVGFAKIDIFDPINEKDLINMAVGRLVLGVRAVESVNLLDATLIAGYETNVKLHSTEKGYIFTQSE